MKIAIGSASICLGRGGTERTATNLARAMLERGHEVCVLARDYGRPPAYGLDSRVRLKFLPDNFFMGKHEHLAETRHFLKSFDVFLSLQSDWAHMCWILACLGSGVPFVCSERADPFYTNDVYWSAAGRHAVLAGADAIHELLPTHLAGVPEIWHSKTYVIGNAAPVDYPAVVPEGGERKNCVLFLGRFTVEKRCQLLVRAFALLSSDFPDWKLRLAGHGGDEHALRKLVERLGIAEKTEFVLQPRWEIECARARIYCLPSRAEGFPNTALEAMRMGLPIVGVGDCPAMRALVSTGNGLLAAADTPQALAAELRKLMESSDLRAKMGQASQEYCEATYSPAVIWPKWEALLMETAAKKGRTVLDAFAEEPFASMATLSAAARREYLCRDFGDPMPYSFHWAKSRAGNFIRNAAALLAAKTQKALWRSAR